MLYKNSGHINQFNKSIAESSECIKKTSPHKTTLDKITVLHKNLPGLRILLAVSHAP
jgi:hypothetical protein